jgi:hypothetical protein
VENPIIEPSDLEELRLTQGTHNELLLKLGQAERQLKAAQDQRDTLHGQIDQFERQLQMTFARVQKKYSLPQSARVNLETGAVE